MTYKCKENDAIIECVDEGEFRIRIDGDTSSVIVGVQDLRNALNELAPTDIYKTLVEADSFLSAFAHNHIVKNDETQKEALQISRDLRKITEKKYPKVTIVNPDKLWTPE